MKCSLAEFMPNIFSLAGCVTSSCHIKVKAYSWQSLECKIKYNLVCDVRICPTQPSHSWCSVRRGTSMHSDNKKHYLILVWVDQYISLMEGGGGYIWPFRRNCIEKQRSKTFLSQGQVLFRTATPSSHWMTIHVVYDIRKIIITFGKRIWPAT